MKKVQLVTLKVFPEGAPDDHRCPRSGSRRVHGHGQRWRRIRDWGQRRVMLQRLHRVDCGATWTKRLPRRPASRRGAGGAPASASAMRGPLSAEQNRAAAAVATHRSPPWLGAVGDGVEGVRGLIAQPVRHLGRAVVPAVAWQPGQQKGQRTGRASVAAKALHRGPAADEAGMAAGRCVKLGR